MLRRCGAHAARAAALPRTAQRLTPPAALALAHAAFAPPAGTTARAVGAVLRGTVLLEQHAGACDVDTLLSVASVSKLMLAVLALQCAERGELSLDDDVRARLSLGGHPAHPRVPVTPRLLLQHCSGLLDDESALGVGRWRTPGADCTVPLAEYVTARLSDPAAGALLWHASPPGAAPYHYSNLGMTLLALYIETCCGGASVAALARERIFAPLGMTRSAFTLAEAARLPGSPRIASPHGSDGRALGVYGVAEWPAAGLRSTAHDLLLLLAAFTGDPAACSLLSASSVASMLPASGAGGLAWWGHDATYGEKDTRCVVWAHGGFMDGMRSHVYLYPRQQLGIVLVQNGEAPYEDAVRAIRAAVTDAAPQLDPHGTLALADIMPAA